MAVVAGIYEDNIQAGQGHRVPKPYNSSEVAFMSKSVAAIAIGSERTSRFFEVFSVVVLVIGFLFSLRLAWVMTHVTFGGQTHAVSSWQVEAAFDFLLVFSGVCLVAALLRFCAHILDILRVGLLGEQQVAVPSRAEPTVIEAKPDVDLSLNEAQCPHCNAWEPLSTFGTAAERKCPSCGRKYKSHYWIQRPIAST